MVVPGYRHDQRPRERTLYARCDDYPRLGVFLRQHERHQVDLSESARAQHAVVFHTSILLVLGSDPRVSTRPTSTPPPLHSPDICGTYGSRKMRVLRETLKVMGPRGALRRGSAMCSHDLRVDSERSSRHRNTLVLMIHNATHTRDIASRGQDKGYCSELRLGGEQKFFRFEKTAIKFTGRHFAGTHEEMGATDTLACKCIRP
jgi:hypothetical protein